MKIWKVRVDSEHYATMNFIEDESYEDLLSFNGIPKLSEWKSVPIDVWDAFLELPLGDITGLEDGVQFLNEKAYSVLQPLLKDYAEFLPINSSTEHCYAMHTTTVMDVFDTDNAVANYFDAEKRRIIICDKYAFKNTDQLLGIPLFRIPQDNEINAFVTDSFLNTVKLNGLTGLAFDLVWDDSEQSAEKVKKGKKNSLKQKQSSSLAEKKPYFEADSYKKEDKQKQDSLLNKGYTIFCIDDKTSGKELAELIYGLVEVQLKQKNVPAGITDTEELYQILGVLFGHAICTGHGWSWKMLKAGNTGKRMAVVSNDEMFSIFPDVLISRILSGDHCGVAGENDNTVMLLYNMIENTGNLMQMLNPDSLKYCPIM